jgi:EmrB/QacA subfamily drug resistance transporter
MPNGSVDSSVSRAALPPKLWPVLIGLMLALTLASLDQNIVATALPRITGELGGLQHLSWVITGFLVASTISAPIYGRLSDLYGRKSAFNVSITVFLLGSVLCGLAGSMAQLIAFRTVQGLGAGGLLVLTQTVVGDLVSPRERGRYQGLFSAVFAVCSVAGPLLGGFIAEYASWRLIFYVNLPVGAASLVLIAGGLRPRPPGPTPRLDLYGAALLTTGTSCLLLVLSWAGSLYAWSSPTILSLGTAAVASFALLVPVELRAAHPILPPELFHSRVFVIGAAAISLTAMALFAAIVFLPLMFQLLMGASPSHAGLMVAPFMGGVIVSSFTGGRLVSRTGRYKLLPVVGLMTATVCYTTLAWAAYTGIRALPIEAVLVVLGLGIGLVMPTLTTAIQNAVRRSVLGGATATAQFFRSLGAAFGVALSGAVLGSHLQRIPGGLQTAASGVAQIAGLPNIQRAVVIGAYRAGLSGTFAVGAGLAALGLMMVLFLPELPLRGIATDEAEHAV